MFNIRELKRSSAQDSPSDAAAERFLTASSGILEAVCGNAGAGALQASRELVEAMESLEHTSAEQLSAMGDLVERLLKRIESNKQTLDTNSRLTKECRESQRAAAQSMAETVESLKGAAQADSKIETRRAEYQAGIEARNRDFEARLRSEYEEFLRMHAQRLARVIGKSQF
ncbi:hypothetical protein GGI15_003410 [Coemansia interrupta]|uniref:Uncharacterized protein n=1 Tax=Coemansia interrupta TaxID=1126814 RepID=A0A9W8HCP0_9FUNG|nr:hypothetical protein GGI15_003410 [Coemansia interrupta]